MITALERKELAMGVVVELACNTGRRQNIRILLWYDITHLGGISEPEDWMGMPPEPEAPCITTIINSASEAHAEWSRNYIPVRWRTPFSEKPHGDPDF